MRSNPNIIGRMCIVRDMKAGIMPGNTLVEAMIIDAKAGENKAKRIRLQTGEHFGEVRFPGEYQFLEFCEHAEAATLIASAWPD